MGKGYPMILDSLISLKLKTKDIVFLLNILVRFNIIFINLPNK